MQGRGCEQGRQQNAKRTQTRAIHSVWILRNCGGAKRKKHESMKASPESPTHRPGRRMSKPLMERRRRERINHSLETLRLLMLESTHNEKLKNPKVEKAEILESVVDFLKEKEMGRGQEAAKRVLSSGQTPACTRLNSYQDGMRSCLLRVSRFIATKSQELEETRGGGGAAPSAFALPEPRALRASPGRVHEPPAVPAAAAPGHAAALSPQHELTRPAGVHRDTRKLLSSTAVSAHLSDPVWRPWPQ